MLDREYVKYCYFAHATKETKYKISIKQVLLELISYWERCQTPYVENKYIDKKIKTFNELLGYCV